MNLVNKLMNEQITNKFIGFAENGQIFENKKPTKRGRNADAQQSLKSPRDTDIETLCAKTEGCKFIGMTL